MGEEGKKGEKKGRGRLGTCGRERQTGNRWRERRKMGVWIREKRWEGGEGGNRGRGRSLNSSYIPGS